MLQSVGLKKVGHDLVTEQPNNSICITESLFCTAIIDIVNKLYFDFKNLGSEWGTQCNTYTNLPFHFGSLRLMFDLFGFNSCCTESLLHASKHS